MHLSLATDPGLRGEPHHVIETKMDLMVLMADDSDLQELQRGSPHGAESKRDLFWRRWNWCGT